MVWARENEYGNVIVNNVAQIAQCCIASELILTWTGGCCVQPVKKFASLKPVINTGEPGKVLSAQELEVAVRQYVSMT